MLETLDEPEGTQYDFEISARVCMVGSKRKLDPPLYPVKKNNCLGNNSDTINVGLLHINCFQLQIYSLKLSRC